MNQERVKHTKKLILKWNYQALQWHHPQPCNSKPNLIINDFACHGESRMEQVYFSKKSQIQDKIFPLFIGLFLSTFFFKYERDSYCIVYVDKLGSDVQNSDRWVIKETM